jgi:hypothetical protein
MFRQITIFASAIVLVLFVAQAGFSEEKTAATKITVAKKPKITVSKETTYFTEPLREDGSLDCIALLNRIASKDVTPENNAAVLLWQAVGPFSDEEKKNESFFKLLGIPCPPEDGDYLIELSQYAGMSGSSKEREKNELRLSYQLDETQNKPWSEDDFPEIAEFLDANQKPLQLALQATERSKFYSPLLAENEDLSSTINLGLMGPLRSMARMLVARAMLNLKKGNEEEAWRDLLAGYRLGRLKKQGLYIVDLLVGEGVESIAAQGIIRMAEHRDLDLNQLQKMLAGLRELPSPTSLDTLYGIGERIFCVGSIYDLARRPQSISDHFLFQEEAAQNTLKKLVNDPRLDWNEVLWLAQEECDRMLQALKLPTYYEANRAVSQIRKEDRDRTQKLLEPDNLKKALSSEATTREIAECFIRLLSNKGILEDFSPVYPATHGTTRFRLVEMSLALSAYHGEHRKYPARLADLVPKYLPKIENDPFCEKEFHYRRENDGYLLYSVGKNGLDDGGRNFNEESETAEDFQNATKEEQARDDIAVRVPRMQGK